MRFQIPVGLCLLALATGPSLISAARPMRDGSGFESRLTGAVTGVSRGPARYGLVEGDLLDGPRFSLELGTQGTDGAIVFSRVGGDVPEPGTYQVASHLGAGSDHGFRALVVTGPPDDPRGVFWARSGTLTITSSTGGLLHGTFRLDAVGFLAGEAELENREIRLNGTFRAEG